MKTNHTKDEQSGVRGIEDWRVKVRDWWYSVQDEAAQAEWGVPEKYRVEIETIIKDLQEQHEAEKRELVKKILSKAEVQGMNGAWVYQGDIKTIATHHRLSTKE